MDRRKSNDECEMMNDELKSFGLSFIILHSAFCISFILFILSIPV
jgi:hypothetical protein